MPRHPLAIAWLLVAASLAADGPPTPEEERAALRLADPGLSIELVAAEPDVVGPVAAAWDEFGRLYVVEMTDYPNADTGGRVKQLEDRDGDGRYERVTVFADGLPFPSGVLPWNGGVLITAAPDLLYFKDGDGDGKAETRRVVLTGFTPGNQQLRVNSPTWGLDNWVYLANGRSGGAVRRPADPLEKALPMPRNDIRVRPETGAVETVAGFSQFGLPRDDRGDRFPSWNTVPIRHVVLEPPASRTVAEILDLSDGGRIYSLAPAQRRFNAETVAFFNATCGPTIYRGDLLGDAYRGDAFVCEPLSGVVHHRRLDPAGPTFVARRVDSERGREFLASTHPWFRPVNLTTGPDGALWVVDFCRAWVEHPDFVPEGQRSAVDFREGHDHGRLWRVVPRSVADRPQPCRPGSDSGAALLAHFNHPNAWCRDTTQRLLVERQDRTQVEPLRRMAREAPSPLARIHALWTLDGLSSLDAETLRAALRADDSQVREQGARLATPRASDYAEELADLCDDADARARLRAAVGLATLDTDSAREALVRLVARDADSPWVTAAILAGPAVRPVQLLGTLAARPPSWASNPTPAQAGFLEALAERIGALGVEAEAREAVETAAAGPSEAFAFAVVRGLDAGRPAQIVEAGKTRTKAADAARSAERPSWLRALALDVAAAGHPRDAKAMIVALLDPAQPPEVQTAAARGVARAGDTDLADDVLGHWDSYSLATRRVLLGSLASSEPLAARLIEAVGGGSVASAEIDSVTRETLHRFTTPAFRDRVAAVLEAAPTDDRRGVVRRYEPALTLPADEARGRDLFAKNCQTCHARGGVGPKVGPDLATVAGRPASDLLVAILDPSREVAPDGTGVVVVTNRGQIFNGLLAEETPGGVRLRRAEGLEDVIPRAEIEALRPTGRSLMPDGLEQFLSPQDMADLIAFLRGPVQNTPR